MIALEAASDPRACSTFIAVCLLRSSTIRPLMCGVEMLDQDEGHPAVRGKKVEELAEGFPGRPRKHPSPTTAKSQSG